MGKFLHLFATVDQPLLLRRDALFLLHPFFNPLHLYGNQTQNTTFNHKVQTMSKQRV